jgi:DMSO reductase family type II enzyme chaperone
VSRDRASVYRGLARLFCLPDADSLGELGRRDLPELLQALQRLGASEVSVRAAGEMVQRLPEASLDRLQRAYQETFEASGGLRCAPNETVYTADTPQKALTSTFELADVAGFYRAFGVEVEPGGERSDHISAELEFMHLLAVKEWVALQEEDGGEQVEICRQAARGFLRDHLARWASHFAEQVEEAATDPIYATAGRLLGGFVAFDEAQLAAE